MKSFIVLLLLTTGAVALEVPNVPGVADSRVNQSNIHQTICRKSDKARGIKTWSQTVRPPTSYTNTLKRKYMSQYRLPGELSDYELDHDIAISNGGDPRDPNNLRLQSWVGKCNAKDKDKLEDKLHRMLCADQVLLKDSHAAQRDWRAGYKRYIDPAGCGGT